MPCFHCNSVKKIVAKGLCSACYQRRWRNGTTDRLRVRKPPHPLDNTWRLLRSRWRGLYPPEWDDIEVFAAVVGDRPDAYAQLRRRDASRPYAADNVRWVRRIEVSERTQYSREWAFRNKYGITVADYDRLLTEQDGGCAICGAAVSFTKAGKSKRLAVDHDHATGAVRGLLCVNCNRGVGYFADNPDRLTKAAAYLAPKPKLKLVG